MNFLSRSSQYLWPSSTSLFYLYTHTNKRTHTVAHTHAYRLFSKKKKKMALCYPSMSCTLLNCFPQILNIRSICGTNENVYWFLVQEVGEIPKISVNSFSVLKIACMSNTSLNAQSMCSCSYPTPTIVLILSLLFSGKQSGGILAVALGEEKRWPWWKRHNVFYGTF